MFRTDSDTEVALHAYLEWGADFVEQIDGMFAIAIWDAREQRAPALPRPPGHQASLLLLRRPPIRVRLRAQGPREGAARRASSRSTAARCYDFLGYRYVPAPKTLYKRCFKLPPAHELVVLDPATGALQSPRRYWSIPIPDAAAASAAREPRARSCAR